MFIIYECWRCFFSSLGHLVVWCCCLFLLAFSRCPSLTHIWIEMICQKHKHKASDMDSLLSCFAVAGACAYGAFVNVNAWTRTCVMLLMNLAVAQWWLLYALPFLVGSHTSPCTVLGCSHCMKHGIISGLFPDACALCAPFLPHCFDKFFYINQMY